MFARCPHASPGRLGEQAGGSREHERPGWIVDQQPAKPGVVHALASQPRHDVDDQVVIAVPAVLRERALVGDVVRHEDLILVPAPDQGQDLAPCARRRWACRSRDCRDSRSSPVRRGRTRASSPVAARSSRCRSSAMVRSMWHMIVRREIAAFLADQLERSACGSARDRGPGGSSAARRSGAGRSTAARTTFFSLSVHGHVVPISPMKPARTPVSPTPS